MAGLFPRENLMFDLVSCQFALHYSFESKEKAHVALKNVSARLKTGGHFIGTIPFADRIVYVEKKKKQTNKQRREKQRQMREEKKRESGRKWEKDTQKKKEKEVEMEAKREKERKKTRKRARERKRKREKDKERKG